MKVIGETFVRNRYEVQQVRGDGAGWWLVAGGATLEEARKNFATLRKSNNALRGFIDVGPSPEYRIVKVEAKCEVVE